MHGRLPLHAEILLRLDDAVAEIGLPIPVDGNAGCQRMCGIDEPPGERQTSERRTRRQRRQDRRHTRLNLVGLIAIVPARQDERIARLLHLRHDHRRGNDLDEIVLPQPEHLELAVGGTQRIGRRVREEILARAIGFILGWLADDAGQNDADRMMEGEVLDLLRSQRAAVEPQVINLPDKRPAERLAPKPQRGVGFDRTTKRIANYLGAKPLAVQIHRDPRGLAGAVVYERDVIPVSQPQSFARANLDGAVGRVRCDPDVQARSPPLNADERHIIKPPLVAAAAICALQLLKARHREVAASLQPDRETERLVALERTDIAETDFRIAVERRRLSNLTGIKRGLATYRTAMLVASGNV